MIRDDYNTYFLDCSCEFDEMTTAGNTAVFLWGNDDAVRFITGYNDPCMRDESVTPTEWKQSRQDICLRLEKYAVDLARRRPEEEQRSLVAAQIVHQTVMIKRMAVNAAEWHYEDTFRGGCLVPFRITARKPTKRVLRRLESRSAIRTYVKRNADKIGISHVRKLVDMWKGMPLPQSPDEAQIVFDRLRDARRGGSKSVPKEMRSVIKRSLSVASGILGEQVVKDFVTGKCVEFPSEDVIVGVSKQSLTKLGHGACEISLTTQDRDPLANLCVYFENTPALDQLAAIGMYALSGNLDELLNKANLYAITDAGSKHDKVIAHYKQRHAQVANVDDDELPDDMVLPDSARPILDDDLAEAMCEYGNKNAEAYIEAVATAIVGSRMSRVFKNHLHQLGPTVN